MDGWMDGWIQGGCFLVVNQWIAVFFWGGVLFKTHLPHLHMDIMEEDKLERVPLFWLGWL